MAILTVTAAANPPLPAAAAKEVTAPADPFSSVMTASMGLKKVNPATGDEAANGTPTKAKKTDSLVASSDMANQDMLTLLAQINAYQAEAASTEVQAQGALQGAMQVALSPLNLTAATPANASQSTPSAQPMVSTPFGASGWNQEVAQQVVVMARDQVQTISLNLNPPNLGPLQVVVKIENHMVNVQFSSAAPEVQQALRDGLPVLQSMLGQAGVMLGQTEIGNRQQQRSPKYLAQEQAGKPSSDGDDFIQSINAANASAQANSLGLVNLYT